MGDRLLRFVSGCGEAAGGFVRGLLPAAIVAVFLFLAPALAYADTYTVDRTDDVVASGCLDGTPNDCSLRGAVSKANTHVGEDTVIVPPGIYRLTIPGANEHANASGDLDILDDIIIIGAGGNQDGDASQTIIQSGSVDTAPGAGFDKVITINPNWDKVITAAIKAVTVRYGVNPSGYTGDGMGGGIDFEATPYNNSSLPGAGSLTLHNVIVTQNRTTDGDGGGVSGFNGLGRPGALLTITDSIITGNATNNGDGGGIASNGLAYVISGTTISNNANPQGSLRGGYGGGLTANASGQITNSTISGNTATNRGAGINSSGPLTMTNVTISGNTGSSQGGGLWAGGATTVTNATITGNTAAEGAGIWTNGVTLHNSLVAGNTASVSLGEVRGTATGNNNLIGTGGHSSGLVNGVNGNLVGVADPKLGTLQDNGGRVKTHALLTASPAIDAGSGASVTATTDARGTPFARTVDGDGNGTATVDIGAFELQSADLTVTLTSGGPFSQGQADANYGITVTNVGTAPATAAETVTLTLPAALTNPRLSGTGWTCNNGTLSCSRSDTLGGTASHPGITLLVDVAAGAPASVSVTATVNMTGDANAANNTATNNTTVRQQTATTTGDATVSYGSTITLSATVTAGVPGTVTFTATGLGTLGSAAVNTTTGTASTSAAAGAVPGSYTLTATFTPSNANYLQSSDTASLTINKASLTITADNKSRAYGSANPTLTVSYAGFVLGQNESSLGGMLSISTTATTGSGVGTYPITASGYTSSNYDITFADGTLTVGPAPLTVRADDKSRAYGAANPTFTVTYSGFANGETEAVLGGTLSFSTAAVASSPAGTYAITPSGYTSANYDITFQNGTLTVTPAALTVTANNATRTYGAANPAFSATYTGFVLGETESVLTGTLSFSAPGAAGGAGTHAITPGGLSSTNYAITFADGTLTITPAPVTVTAADAIRTYGAPNPAFTATYTGLVNGETPAGLGLAPTFSTTAVTASAPGTYPVTPGSLSSPNYTFAYVDGTLTITPAALTVTANNASRTYGAANPAFTVTYSGFVAGDTEAALTGTLAFSTTAAPASPAGSVHPITPAGLTSPNYAITYVDGTLTVTTAPLTIKADDKTRAFGAANPPLTATYTGFVLGETEAALAGTLSLSTAATPASPIGTYPISVAGVTSINYDITFVPGTLSVTNAVLTIRADDKSRVYGDPNPAFTVTYTGFVGGDTPAVLSGTLSITTAATAASPVGTYAITPSGLTASNYTLVFAPGVLTVTPRPLSVSASNASRAYGDANPPLTGTVSGAVNGDSISGSFATLANATSPVGTYPITASVSGNVGNYTVFTSNGVLTVTPAPLTVAVANASRMYGEPNPTFQATVTGLKNGDQVGVTFSTSATSSSNVGTYPITGAVTGATSNYTVTVTNGTLTIAPAPLTVTADDAAKVEGEPNPPLKGSLTGVRPGDAIHADFTTIATKESAPGTYPITPALRDPRGALGNYTVTSHPGTLMVTGCTPEHGQDNGRTVTRNRCRASRSVEEEVVQGQTAALIFTPASVAQATVDHAAQTNSPHPPRLIMVAEQAADVTGGIIGAEGIRLLAAADGEIQVQTPSGSLLIAARTLQRLGAAQSDTRTVILFDEVQMPPPTDRWMTAASPAVEITVALLSGHGTLTPKTRFSDGLVLSLPIADGAALDLELAGIYQYVEDGTMAYIGGDVNGQNRWITGETDHLSRYGVIIYDREYDDVAPEHWAYRNVKVMTARHVVQGVSQTHFDPDRAVTRAEFATMMARAFGIDAAPVLVRSFADVAPDAWHAGIMLAMVNEGLFSPEPGNVLRPDEAITREEMAVVIALAMERFYPQKPLPAPDVDEVLARFRDQAEVTPDRRDEMARLVESGLVKG
ncbi:MAG TPA: MBG domain-containing protein, partial [Symbiobacteriaceae bacterium]|nr:MBG domain-containing protein [Symbiobacteriaceae bacterium]